MRVTFLSKEIGEEVFHIPPPFITEANGLVSHDVDYEVKTVADGKVQMIVTADSDWLKAIFHNQLKKEENLMITTLVLRIISGICLLVSIVLLILHFTCQISTVWFSLAIAFATILNLIASVLYLKSKKQNK